MVLIEDITEAEAQREAAEAAARRAAEQVAAAEVEAVARRAAEQAAAQASKVGAAQAEGSTSQPAAGGEQESQPAGTELSEVDQERLEQAEELKRTGNELYARERWDEALAAYEAALAAAPEAAKRQRAVCHGNRAACHLKLEQHAEAAQECTTALELDPGYSKVLLRRSTAYEKLDDLERALADAEKVVELEPGNGVAQGIVKRLTPVVMERREKLKEEMMGKLKDLGNMVLGKFGLSVDNFKAEQDPATGSYSIKFQQ